jgi:hypothetical protein
MVLKKAGISGPVNARTIVSLSLDCRLLRFRKAFSRNSRFNREGLPILSKRDRRGYQGSLLQNYKRNRLKMGNVDRA